MLSKDLLKDKLLKNKTAVELGVGETAINNWGKIFTSIFKFSLYFKIVVLHWEQFYPPGDL